MKIALVGKGRWGQNYIKTLSAFNGVVFSKDLIKTRDYPDLFNHRGIDGVIIASATDTHFKVASDLIRRGFNVLIEKPITTTYKQAVKLKLLHKKHAMQIVMAGHIQIYDPGYQKLKQNLDKVGEIEKIIFKGTQEEPRADSSVLENWGPHPIYMFIDIVGESPISVSASQTTQDNYTLGFEFSKGVTGTAEIGISKSNRKRELTVIGNLGKITFDWSKGKRLTFTNSNKIVTNLEFSQNISPLQLELAEFFQCIKDHKDPKTSLDQGIEVIRIIDLLREQID